MRFDLYGDVSRDDIFSDLALDPFSISFFGWHPDGERSSVTEPTPTLDLSNIVFSNPPTGNVDDDFAGDTSTTGVLELGGSVNGRTDFSDDRDWFALTVEAGDIVSFNYTGIGWVSVFAPDGSSYRQFLTLIDPVLFEQSATYFIEVRGFEEEDYRLSASTATRDDYAGDITTSGTLQLGAFASGDIDYSGDRDWFAINAQLGDSILFMGGSGDQSVTWAIYDSSGTIIEDDVNAQRFRFSETATYYLEARSFFATDYFMDATNFGFDDIADDATTTEVLELGGSASGTINFFRDNDWFALSVEARDVVTFTSSGAGVEAIALYDSTGEFYSSTQNGAPVLFEETGTYYLEVRGNAESDTPYTVEASTAVKDEHTADATTTGALSLGGSVAGVIDFRFDRDWFLVTVEDGDIIKFDWTGDGALTLFAPDGSELAIDPTGFTYVFEVGGDYYIEAAGDLTGETYTITASNPIEDDFADDENTTGVLTVGDTTTGRIDYVLDADAFALEVEAGTTYEIIISDGITSATATRLSSSGREFTVARDKLLADGTRLIEFIAQEDDTVFVTVDADSSRAEGLDYSISVAATDLTMLTIDDVSITDHLLDRDSGILYMSTREGVLFRFDTNTQTYLENVFLGGISTELAIAQDNSTLYVGSRLSQGGDPFAHILDLNTLAIEIGVVSGSGTYAFDLGIGLSSTLFISSDRSVEEFDTLTFDSRLSSNRDIQFLDRAAIDTSEDGRYLLFVEARRSSADAVIFDTLTNETLGASVPQRSGFSTNKNAISSALGIAAIVNTRRVDFTDLTLEIVATFESEDVQDVLFGNNNFAIYILLGGDDGNRIAVLDALTFEEIRSVTLDGVYSSFQIDNNGQAYLFEALDNFNEQEALVGTVSLGSRISGMIGDDVLSGTISEDWILADDGDDILRGLDGLDYLDGGDGDDILFGGNHSDRLDGGAGRDRLFGEDGNDRLEGGDGNDSLNGGLGDDRLFGDAGNDSLQGREGADELHGGYGDDTLNGGDGDDQLFGGADNDFIIGGNGLDSLDGGEGVDTLYAGEGDDSLVGGLGNDRLFGQNGDDTLDGGDGDDLLNGGSGVDSAFGGTGNDTFYMGADDDTASGGEGDDTIFGNGGNDRLEGDAGNDTLNGGNGRDYLLGGDGVDRLLGGSDNDTLDGGADDDDLFGQNGNDVIRGGSGDDLLNGGNGNDYLVGGTGNDLLIGGNNDDTLIGGDGNDWMYGGGGSDVINGGAGINNIFGNGGADTFDRSGDGTDIILDFGASDRIVISSLISDFDDLLDNATDTARGVQIANGDDGFYILTGFTVADLRASFFEFEADAAMM